MTVKCPGCKDEFRNVGAYMSHCVNSKTCTAEDRFWPRVKKGKGCWLFMGCRDKDNYGDLSYNGKHIQAHRLAWKLLRGEPGKMDVLHKCDNPPCCNPDHLYLGTDLENARDRIKFGKHLRGEAIVHAKLTDDAVREIRAAYKQFSPRRTNSGELAAKYGVSRGSINAAVRGYTWAHIK